jgi:membrane fusion protein (multidrug efflux system)
MKTKIIFKNKMKNIFIIMIAALGLMISSCKNNNDPLEKKKTELSKLIKEQEELAARIKKLETEISDAGGDIKSDKPVDVEISELKKQSFKHYIEVEGKVDGNENIGVSTQMPGTVSKVLVNEGDQVRKGQVLAQLENQSMLNGLEELKTSVAFVNSIYQKQKNLWDQKIGTEIQFLTAKNNKEALEKKMETLKEQIELTKIKSPIDGTVEEITAKIGQSVAPGYPVFRVVNFSSLKVMAEISESYASKVREGNNVSIRFPDLNREIESKISFSSKFISPENRTFSVEASLPNAADYKPNMIAEVKIVDYSNDTSIVIPVNIAQDSENGKYVYTAVNERGKLIAKKQFIKFGLTYNGLAQIVSGLSENDKLITTGYQDVNNGQIIKF